MVSNFPLFEIVTLVLASAFFSAAETSFFSLSRLQLRQLKQKNQDIFARVRHLLDKPASLVVTVLIGNELTNVTANYVLATYYESMQLTPLWITIFNLMTVVPIFLILSDITPKVLGAKANFTLTLLLTNPFWLMYKALFPVRFFIEILVNSFTRWFRAKPSAEPDFKEEDFRMLLDEGKKKGAIHSMEQELIENLFETDDDRILEIATPLQDTFTVHQNESPKTVIEKLSKDFYARIPVRGDAGKIVGILYAKDLLNYLNRQEQEMTVRDLMKEPLIVQAGMKVEVLFRRFRQLKRHIAIVEDRKGRAIGVITMEDVLDQIFGELWGDSR